MGKVLSSLGNRVAIPPHGVTHYQDINVPFPTIESVRFFQKLSEIQIGPENESFFWVPQSQTHPAVDYILTCGADVYFLQVECYFH